MIAGHDLRLAGPAVAAWLVAWQGRLLPPATLVVAALVVLLAAAALVWRSAAPRALVAAAVLGCAAASALVTGLHVDARSRGPLVAAAQRQAAVTVEAVVLDDPRALTATAQVLAVRDLSVARVRVERLEMGARRFALRQPVLVLSQDDSWIGLLPSQRVRVEGMLRPAERGDDVAAVLSTRGPAHVLGQPSAVQRAAGKLRQGLRDAVRPLPSDERGLLPGLVDGDVSQLDPAVREAFRATGLTHLTAVSGTNVAIVLAAALLLCSWLRLPLRVRPLVGAAALFGFVILARPSPSVLRAAVMGLVALLALGTGVRRQALPALCTAVLALVLLQPDLAAAPGFALSVLATAGLLVLAPVWRDRWSRRMPRWLAEALAVPAAAQLACTPVLVGVFGQLGLWAVPANLLAVPAVAPATVLGVAAAVVSPLWLPLAQALAWAAWLPTHWLVLVARVGARQPGAEVTVPAGWTGVLLVLAALLTAVFVLRTPTARRTVAVLVVGAVLAGMSVTVVLPGWPARGWVLASCDVGQGDAFVVRLGPGSALVVDNGPDPERVDRCLRRLGVRRVPLLMLSHLHADHIEGVPGLLRGRKVGAVQINQLDEPAVEKRRLQGWLAARGIPLLRAQTGERRVMAGVSWVVLDATVRRGTDSDPNNSSVVLKLQTSGISVLFGGDLETDAQAELLARGADLRADVLKVPHHGSGKQHPGFLDAVRAKVALTPVGAGNPYGHPAASTLDRITRAGTRLFRSDLHGDVAVVVRDGRVTAVARGPDGWRSLLASPGHHVDAADARPATGIQVAPATFSGAFSAGTQPGLWWCDTVVVQGPMPPPRARDPPSTGHGEMDGCLPPPSSCR